MQIEGGKTTLESARLEAYELSPAEMDAVAGGSEPKLEGLTQKMEAKLLLMCIPIMPYPKFCGYN